MDKKKYTYTMHTLNNVVHDLKAHIDRASVITLTGPLGAGKTTLVKEIMMAMEVTDLVTSPTYTYLNQYRMPNGFMIYHFDLYRIQTYDDFIGAGFHEYFGQPRSKVFVEWPQVLLPYATDSSFLHITIAYTDQDNMRTLEFSI